MTDRQFRVKCLGSVGEAMREVSRAMRLIRNTAGPDRDGRRRAAIRRLSRNMEQLHDFANVLRATVSQKPRKRAK